MKRHCTPYLAAAALIALSGCASGEYLATACDNAQLYIMHADDVETTILVNEKDFFSGRLAIVDRALGISKVFSVCLPRNSKIVVTTIDHRLEILANRDGKVRFIYFDLGRYPRAMVLNSPALLD